MSFSQEEVEVAKKWASKKTASNIRFFPKEQDIIISATLFLPENSIITQRLWHILNNMYEIPKCRNCNINIVRWHPSIKGYAEYCSLKCGNSSTTKIDKKKKTCLEKYGVDSYSKTDAFISLMKQQVVSEEIKEKRKQTCLEKYGVETPLLNDDIREKTKETNIERYGVENVFASDGIKQKIRNTNRLKYGTDYYVKTSEFDNKMKEYYTDEEWLKTKTQKQQQVMIDKYGVTNHFLIKNTKEEIDKLNNKEWLEDQHNNRKTIRQIASELNFDKKTISTYMGKHGIDIKRFPASYGEIEISNFIRNECDIELINNTRNIIPPKELDIFIPSHNFAIEYCGLYWHSSLIKDKHYHNDKLLECEKRNIRLLTVYEDEWLYKQDIVKTKIKDILGINNDERIYARKCSIKTISSQEYIPFLEKYHIQGKGQASKAYGLFYNNILVAVILFKKEKNDIFSLTRYASSGKIVGGFSKLFSHFKKNNIWSSVYTFANRRWSDGKLYEVCGFNKEYITNPDYEYIINNKRVHKFSMRKKKLLNILENFDETLSETENTRRNNIPRIYHCGLIKYFIKIS